jgi:hypothetical protein
MGLAKFSLRRATGVAVRLLAIAAQGDREPTRKKTSGAST